MNICCFKSCCKQLHSASADVGAHALGSSVLRWEVVAVSVLVRSYAFLQWMIYCHAGWFHCCLSIAGHGCMSPISSCLQFISTSCSSVFSRLCRRLSVILVLQGSGCRNDQKKWPKRKKRGGMGWSENAAWALDSITEKLSLPLYKHICAQRQPLLNHRAQRPCQCSRAISC